jgi:hypothetical protein
MAITTLVAQRIDNDPFPLRGNIAGAMAEVLGFWSRERDMGDVSLSLCPFACRQVKEVPMPVDLVKRDIPTLSISLSYINVPFDQFSTHTHQLADHIRGRKGHQGHGYTPQPKWSYCCYDC